VPIVKIVAEAAYFDPDVTDKIKIDITFDQMRG
jgi:hypothetical protein